MKISDIFGKHWSNSQLGMKILTGLHNITSVTSGTHRPKSSLVLHFCNTYHLLGNITRNGEQGRDNHSKSIDNIVGNVFRIIRVYIEEQIMNRRQSRKLESMKGVSC